jgi:hypothetical protein
MEAIYSFETLVDFHHTARCYNQEDINLQDIFLYNITKWRPQEVYFNFRFDCNNQLNIGSEPMKCYVKIDLKHSHNLCVKHCSHITRCSRSLLCDSLEVKSHSRHLKLYTNKFIPRHLVQVWKHHSMFSMWLQLPPKLISPPPHLKCQ